MSEACADRGLPARGRRVVPCPERPCLAALRPAAKPEEKMKYDLALSQAEEQRKNQLFTAQCGGGFRRMMRRALLQRAPNGVCA